MVWLVLGIIAVLALGWFVTAQSAVRGVTVFQDAQPVVCTSVPVTSTDTPLLDAEPGTADAHLPTVVLQPGQQCTFRLYVLNEGWATVEIDGVHLPLLGDGSALGITQVSALLNPAADLHNDEPQMDAFAGIQGVSVPPGSSQLVEVRFAYDGGAQLGQCGAVTASPLSVQVSALGATATPTSAMPIIYHRGDPADCRG